jgi:hypothetical protein
MDAFPIKRRNWELSLATKRHKEHKLNVCQVSRFEMLAGT